MQNPMIAQSESSKLRLNTDQYFVHVFIYLAYLINSHATSRIIHRQTDSPYHNKYRD